MTTHKPVSEWRYGAGEYTLAELDNFHDPSNASGVTRDLIAAVRRLQAEVAELRLPAEEMDSVVDAAIARSKGGGDE